MTSTKKAPKAATKSKVAKPAHPLMRNGHDWDIDKVVMFVCEQTATTSLGIGSILKNGYQGHNLPVYSTFMLWLEKDPLQSERYAKSKEAQADYMADEMLDIADSKAEYVVDQHGVSRKDSADVQHKRLRVETRKWLASKLKPKKYGDKVQQEVSGLNGGAISHSVTGTIDVTVTPDEAYKRLLG